MADTAGQVGDVPGHPPILTGLLLLVAIGILNMDASHIALLWVFLSFGAEVIAMGTLVLFAAFGNLGQLVAMLLFVYLALASSGGESRAERAMHPLGPCPKGVPRQDPSV